MGDWRGAGGGGAGSRPETSWVEGSVSRPAVATGGKRRRGSGSASSGVDDVLLVLVEAMFALCGSVSHARRAVILFRTNALRRTSAGNDSATALRFRGRTGHEVWRPVIALHGCDPQRDFELLLRL